MRTYGTLSYVEATGTQPARWQMTCEPHVSLVLKRVFARLAKSSYGTHFLNDCPEVCCDLVWFLKRYPMKVSRRDREYLDSKAVGHSEALLLVDKLRSGLAEPRRFELAIPLRRYQTIEAEVLLTTRGAVVGSDLGLGKTASLIGVLTPSETRPALFITLAGAMPNQIADEIHKFAPTLTCHVAKSRTPYDLTKARLSNGHGKANGRFPDVVVMNYHKVSGWAETLAGIVKTVLIDECQELRTGRGTGKYDAIKHLADAAIYRAGASTTPIYNYGAEFWWIMDVVKPGALGEREEFLREWCAGGECVDNPKAFGSYLRETGLMVRHTRQEVGLELPEVLNIPHRVECDTRKLDELSASCAELAKFILEQSETRRGEKLQASEELDTRLRQATGIAKAPFVAEFVKMLVESGESVLLYGWHHAVYDIWLDHLKDYSPALYTGRESAARKTMEKLRFLNKETPVMIMSLRSGAGLEGLQNVCRTIVNGELDWSWGVHVQGTGRLNRDRDGGIKEAVTAYYMIADSGSDPVVADVLGLKKMQLHGIIDPNEDLIQRIQNSGEHVKKLAKEYLEQLKKRRRRLTLEGTDG